VPCHKVLSFSIITGILLSNLFDIYLDKKIKTRNFILPEQVYVYIISHALYDDTIVWNGSKNRIFLIKSVLYAAGHLPGVKSGRQTGQKLFIAVKDAEAASNKKKTPTADTW
jgi:hypothetical protein